MRRNEWQKAKLAQALSQDSSAQGIKRMRKESGRQVDKVNIGVKSLQKPAWIGNMEETRASDPEIEVTREDWREKMYSGDQ